MSLESQLWREVCQHLELEESVQGVFAILAEHVRLDALIIRRLERDPMRLVTIAVGCTGWRHQAAPMAGPHRAERALGD